VTACPSDRVRAEAKDGALLVSYRFTLPKEQQGQGIEQIVDDEEEFCVYRVQRGGRPARRRQ
jgi:hypothetical protein